MNSYLDYTNIKTDSASDEGTKIDWLTALIIEYGVEIIFE